MVRGVLFDWRGTLVADPPDEWWVAQAVERVGRSPREVGPIAAALAEASSRPDVVAREATIDCSAAEHRAASMEWVRAAGLDDELAEALYALDFEAANHPFFSDVAGALRALHERDVAVAIVSDIHFDLRPEFEAARLDAFVDSYVLSFEHGVQKPDPAIFRIAAASLGLGAPELLMVGDRVSHDGGAVALGIPTLLLPSLRTADAPRGLAAVVALVDAHAHGSDAHPARSNRRTRWRWRACTCARGRRAIAG